MMNVLTYLEVILKIVSKKYEKQICKKCIYNYAFII